MSSSELHKVFVYGTLKKGLPNHYLMQNQANGLCQLNGYAITQEKFPLIIGSSFCIPMMLEQRGHGMNIKGEVYEVDSSMLAVLDILEGHPTFYKRSTCEVRITESFMEEIAQASLMQCHVYVIDDFKPELLDLPYLDYYNSDLSLEYINQKARQSHESARDQVKLAV